jgi:hypothetical protein
MSDGSTEYNRELRRRLTRDTQEAAMNDDGPMSEDELQKIERRIEPYRTAILYAGRKCDHDGIPVREFLAVDVRRVIAEVRRLRKTAMSES